jgi:hypothetical protein
MGRAARGGGTQGQKETKEKKYDIIVHLLKEREKEEEEENHKGAEDGMKKGERQTKKKQSKKGKRSNACPLWIVLWGLEVGEADLLFFIK